MALPRLVLVLALLLLGLSPLSSAQGLGGYSVADPTSREVIDAAQFAVSHGDNAISSESLATLEVAQAHKQVIKGIKYELAIRATAKTFQCQLVSATVFQDLGGSFSILDKAVQPCLSSFRGKRSGRSVVMTPKKVPHMGGGGAAARR